MSSPLLLFRLAGFLLLTVAAARAGLTWETTRIEATLAPQQEQYVTRFHFKNTGAKSVTITDVRPGCGCTTADLPKRTYAPGETGYVHVTFTVGDHAGLQQKAIVVVTDDAPDHPTALMLRLTVTAPVTLDQRLLVWAPGDSAREKSVAITVSPDAHTKIVGVRSNISTVAATLAVDEADRRYRLVVKPDPALTAGRATLLIDTECGGQPKVYSVYALIR